MPKRTQPPSPVKLSKDQIEYLEARMAKFAHRNPSSGISTEDYRKLYAYLAVQKITYLYDDELLEKLTWVDTKETGMSEELLDAFLIADLGGEIHLNLFQFKFRENYDGGISTKDLYAFVDRMNRVFLRGDLLDEKTLKGFSVVRKAFEEARRANRRARSASRSAPAPW